MKGSDLALIRHGSIEPYHVSHRTAPLGYGAIDRTTEPSLASAFACPSLPLRQLQGSIRAGGSSVYVRKLITQGIILIIIDKR